jgi:hypothetical protein
VHLKGMDHYIKSKILEGEHQQLDFKFEISDSRKIARTLVAFSNTDGGTLLIGVKDNGKIAGVRSEEEFYMVQLISTVSLKLYSIQKDGLFQERTFLKLLCQKEIKVHILFRVSRINGWHIFVLRMKIFLLQGFTSRCGELKPVTGEYLLNMATKSGSFWSTLNSISQSR